MPQKKENYILHTNVYIYLVCIHIYMYTYIYINKYNIYIYTYTYVYIYIFRLWLRHDLMFLPATAAKIYQPFTKQSSPNAFLGGRNLTSSITWIFLNHLKSKFCMVESLFYLEISPTTLGTKKQKKLMIGLQLYWNTNIYFCHLDSQGTTSWCPCSSRWCYKSY